MTLDAREPEKRVKSRDIPRLLDLLACDDAKAQTETLTLLCPCRNVRYDKEVWIAIFRAAECPTGPGVRDRAEHAIGTLRERARTDPRSQELIQWLVDRGTAPKETIESVPVWRPFLGGIVNGHTIPKYERPSRTRKNRARR